MTKIDLNHFPFRARVRHYARRVLYCNTEYVMSVFRGMAWEEVQAKFRELRTELPHKKFFCIAESLRTPVVWQGFELSSSTYDVGSCLADADDVVYIVVYKSVTPADCCNPGAIRVAIAQLSDPELLAEL